MALSLPNGPSTLAALRAMQSIILTETLVGGSSPFAALSAADQIRYGAARAVLIGKPKDFKDSYLPQCNIWVPAGDAAAGGAVGASHGSSGSPDVELMSYAGRVFDEVEAIVTTYVDMRTDWYAGEQQVLQIRDALWPAVLHHERLGGTVAGVVESWAREGKGLAYEEIAGVTYRAYELRWGFRQQWNLSGGRAI